MSMKKIMPLQFVSFICNQNKISLMIGPTRFTWEWRKGQNGWSDFTKLIFLGSLGLQFLEQNFLETTKETIWIPLFSDNNNNKKKKV